MKFIKLNTTFLDASGCYYERKGRQMNIERLYCSLGKTNEHGESYIAPVSSPSFFQGELSYHGNKVTKNIPNVWVEDLHFVKCTAR